MRVAAAVAVVGRQSVGSHRDAAALQGIELIGQPAPAPAPGPGPGPVSVTRPLDTPGSRSGRPGIRLHVAALPDGHRGVAHGVPVTTPARTVIDLARTNSFRDGVVAADSALRKRLTTKPELCSIIRACAGWRGITEARAVAEFSDARSESAFESIARVVFHLCGLPPPELQAWVGGGGVVIGRTDFFWPDFSTIAEADGAMKYADPQQARIQLDRDARLREAGFEVVHFGWRELHLNPDQVVDSIKLAFGRGAASRQRQAGSS